MDTTDQLLLQPQHDNEEANQQFSQLFSKQQEEARNLSELSALTNRLLISEERYQTRLQLMEKEQSRFTQRFEELRFLLARAVSFLLGTF